MENKIRSEMENIKKKDYFYYQKLKLTLPKIMKKKL